MPQRKVLLIVTGIAVLASTAVHAQGCLHPLGPLAAKKSVALAIFNAIADGLESSVKRAKYDTEIGDRGTSWSIFESVKGGSLVRTYDAKGTPLETIHVTMGGGGLGMYVDKCTAAVSDVSFQR
jgi:hypothetical protein